MHLKMTTAAFVILTIILIQNTLITMAATIRDDNLDNRRSKRSLTTICVEIKPSKPQEESYFMCKESDFPNFRTAPQNFGSNEPSVINSAMPRYDETHTTSVPASEKENYFRLSATHDSGSQTFRQHQINNAPNLYKDERFQLQSMPTSSAYHYQQPKITPTTFLAKNEDVQTNFRNTHAQQKFHTENPIQIPSTGAQSAFDIRYTTGTAQPKPFTAAQTIDQTTTTVHTNRPHEIQQYHREIFTNPIQSFGAQNVPSTTSFAHSGSFAPSSFVRNDKVANFEKTPVFPTINAAHEVTAPIMARKFSNSPFATTTTTAATAAATTTPTTATTATTATAPIKSLATHKIAATVEKAITPTEYFDKSRYRMAIDENSLKVPSWTFSPHEFDAFRIFSNNKRGQSRENLNAEDDLTWETVPVQQSKIVIPHEHLDDPVMRTFYESIYDTKLPPIPPPPSSYAPIVGAIPNIPVDAFERSYSPDVYKTERCPAQYRNTPTYVTQQPSNIPNYLTQPVSSCGSATPFSAAQLSTVQQIQPSIINAPYEQLPKATYQCPTCPTSTHNFQPVILALPYYSQQITPQQYDTDGAPQVSSALSQQQMTEPVVGWVNPLSNLLFGPRIFDLFNPIRGLLGQTAPVLGSHNPYAVLNVAPIAMPMPDAQKMNVPMEKSKSSTNNEQNKRRKVTKNENKKENDDAMKSEEINNGDGDNDNDEDNETVSASREIDNESQEQSTEQNESTSIGIVIPDENFLKLTTKKKNDKKDDSKKSKESSNVAEIPKDLEEESKKTFKTLIDAAKTFSNFAQTETGTEIDEISTTETTGRKEKRQQSKGGSNVANFMRKSYKMKL